jgi:hypothetical protein
MPSFSSKYLISFLILINFMYSNIASRVIINTLIKKLNAIFFFNVICIQKGSGTDASVPDRNLYLSLDN